MIPAGELDFWDYCMRKLFVLRATPLSESMLCVAMRISRLQSATLIYLHNSQDAGLRRAESDPEDDGS